MKTTKFLTLIVALGLINLTSCQKEKISPEKETTTTGISIKKNKGPETFKFQVGLKVKDHGNESSYQFTHSFGGSWSGWAKVNGCSRPDYIKLTFDILLGEISDSEDFRIGIQAAGECGSSDAGTVVWSNWASETYKWSDIVRTASGSEPEAYRITIETRTWSLPFRVLSNFHIGIRVYDNDGANSGDYRFTPKAITGGGSTGWTSDNNSYNPEGFKIMLKSNTVSSE